jgi:hypothetical protein
MMHRKYERGGLKKWGVEGIGRLDEQVVVLIRGGYRVDVGVDRSRRL